MNRKFLTAVALAAPPCPSVGCISSSADPMKGFTTMISLRKFCRSSIAWIATLCLMCGFANATVIDTETLTLTSADPTQMGRLNRNGIISDWSGPKPFPGVVNPATPYHYITCDLDVGALEAGLGFSYGGFIQIDFDSTAATTFLSAYLDAYSPSNLAANYLGDEGASGNFFGVDPRFFQVVVPSGHDLVLVFNETTTNGGLNLPGDVTVEAFADTLFTDLSPLSPAPVPEPSTLSLLMCGIAFAAARRFLARNAAASGSLLTLVSHARRQRGWRQMILSTRTAWACRWPRR